jgi:hypothetical protein
VLLVDFDVTAIYSLRDWGYMIALWSSEKDVMMMSKVKRKLRKLFGTHTVKYQVTILE